MAGLGPMYEPTPGKPSRHSFTNRSLKPRPGRESSGTNSTAWIGRVSAPSATAPSPPADDAGLEGDVHDVSRNVVAQVQKPADLDFGAGLFPHLPGQGLFEGLASLDLATGQGPAAWPVGVLVEKEDLVVVAEDDACDPCVQHSPTLQLSNLMRGGHR